MRKYFLFFALLMAMSAATGRSGEIDDALAAALRVAPQDQFIKVLVYLKNQVDLETLENHFNGVRADIGERHEVTVRALMNLAAESQGDLLDYLQGRTAAGDVRDLQAFWIANVVALEATPDEIHAIAERDDVGTIFLDFPIVPIEPVGDGDDRQADGVSTGDITSGVREVHAPECWAIGVDGSGVLVATLDTGVDGNHPALADRWRGLDARYQNNPEWAFFDPVTNRDFPFDSGSHGTHTMGSVCGGRPGEQVGVAPGAQWIHAAVIDRGGIPETVRDAMLAFQWIIDPDGNPNTSFDVPVSCSNSWGLATGHGYPPCDQTFWQFLDACETAGVVIIFSAGNEGPGSETLRRPADRATDDYRTFAVGAVDANQQSLPIASFSSRGPSHCTPNGAAAVKPEVAAPGVSVRSSIPGSGYASFNGTSMASPHVNGAVALIRQVNRTLSVQEVKDLLMRTSRDLGPSGDDNDYGRGFIDAFAAVSEAMSRDEIWVDFAYQGVEDGSFDRPYNSLAEGLAAAPAGGVINIKAGSSSETPSINQSVTINAYGGPVDIGG